VKLGQNIKTGAITCLTDVSRAKSQAYQQKDTWDDGVWTTSILLSFFRVARTIFFLSRQCSILPFAKLNQLLV